MTYSVVKFILNTMKKPTKQQVLKTLYGYVIMTFAGLLNAISMFCLIDPCNLIAGGVSGLSSAVSYIVCYFIGDHFNLVKWIAYFALNAPLLICSLIYVRGDFTFKTIWATIVCTAAGFLFDAYLPEVFRFNASPLISILFGGVIIGFSMYIASEENGSNGGTEIIAKIVEKKKPGTDLSTIILISNLSILFVGAIIVMILQHKRLGVLVYSLMYAFLGSGVMGMFKRGFNHPQKFSIITTKPDELSKAIMQRFKRGLTYIDVENTREGSEDRKMVIVIVQYRQAAHLKRIIKQCDPKAFTVVKDVHDVFSRPLFNRSYKTK